MKKTKPLLLAIAIAIAGLMIAVSASTAIQTQTPQDTDLVLVKNPSDITIAGRDACSITGTLEPVEYSEGIMGATPIFPGYHPAVASDALGYLVLGFEDDQPNVWFTGGTDSGQTWAEDAIGWQIDPPPELPDVDSCGDGRYIGGMVPNYMASDGSELYKVECVNPMDISETGYSCPYWDWWDVGDGYTNFDSIAVAGYTAEDPAENTWAFGGHAITGDHGGEAGDDTIFFSYQFDETGYAWIYYWTNINGCEDSAHDIDPGNLYSYPAWTFDNEGTIDIYVNIFDFGVWEPYGEYVIHPEIGDFTIETSGNDEYIDISALNDNIIIVSQRDEDVVAYYSTDGMTTVNEAAIVTDADNPRIVHISNNTATCAFIQGSKVYYATTEDGGATWSTPELIDEPENNFVPEEYKASDVCGFGATWMNSDDGNVYFAGFGGNPPSAPDIDGKTSGKFGESYEYTFVATDPDGDDLVYYIDWGDDTFEEWIGPYASGEEVKVSHTWEREGVNSRGTTFTIKSKARDTFGLEGPWGTLDVTMPKSKARFQPLFMRLLERFPHAFPLLRTLFGL